MGVNSISLCIVEKEVSQEELIFRFKESILTLLSLYQHTHPDQESRLISAKKSSSSNMISIDFIILNIHRSLAIFNNCHTDNVEKTEPGLRILCSLSSGGLGPVIANHIATDLLCTYGQAYFCASDYEDKWQKITQEDILLSRKPFVKLKMNQGFKT